MAQDLTVGIAGLGAIGLHLARALDAGVQGLRLAAVTRGPQEGAGQCRRLQGAAHGGLERRARRRRRRGRSRPRHRLRGDRHRRHRGRPHLRPLLRRRAAAAHAPGGARQGRPARASSSPPARCSASMPCAPPPRARSRASPSRRASPRAASRARPIWSSTASTCWPSPRRRCIFKGNAFDAAQGFPANVNVAAALALAGIGPRAHHGRDLGRPRTYPQHSTPSASRPPPRA